MITLTDAAVKHAKEAIAMRGGALGFRVGIKRTGCSGFAYTLDYVDKKPEQFLIEFESDDIKVFVDPKDIMYLEGLKMDYVKKGLNEGYEFFNPLEKHRCGCGESFSV